MEHIANIETLADFWALVTDVWNHGFMGVAIGQIVAALLILALAAAVRRLFGYVIIKHIRFWTRRAGGTTGDAVIEALAPPIRFIPIVVAVFVISQIVSADPRMTGFFAAINRSLIAFTIFWALFQIVEPVLGTFDRLTAVFSRAMVEWTVKVGKILFVALGGATILEIWGIEVGPILAGLGLFGVAVALGAQDLFKNLIAGIFIIGERRFQHGDWILAEGVVEGTVETIGLRTTKVRRFDKAPVYVPNAKLADNAITNFSQMTHRRISWIIKLQYRTKIEQLRQIRDAIEAFIVAHPGFADPSEVSTFVRIDRFNDSSIDIMLYCFTRSTVWGEWLKIKEELTCEIKAIVEKAGAGFALPGRALYVETMPEGAELFPLQAT